MLEVGQGAVDRLARSTRRAEDVPFRAVGGRVLLRRVREDSPLLINQTRDPGVLQIGEVVGLGSRWTQEGPWVPPISIQGQRERRYDNSYLFDSDGNFDPVNGHSDPDWKPVHVEERPRVDPPAFHEGHRQATVQVGVGDLVVFNNARVYDTFHHDGEEFLVYPGNWLLAKIEGSYLSDNPDARRYAVDAP